MVPENVYTEMIGFVLLVLTPAVMSCAVFDFEENYGVVYDGDVTQVQVDRPVAASDCRRACILTPGCRGFNMRWIGTPGEVGYCSLTAMTTHASLLRKRGNSFYAWCPHGMKFSLGFARCYVVVKERKSWQDSEEYCKTQHRQAHLAEIYDVIQNSAFRKMTNDLSECRFTPMGTEYMGRVSTTKTGVPCQKWSSQTPRVHYQNTKALAWTLERNYCRNPDHGRGPWCYTSYGDKPWDVCSIANCTDVLEPNPIDPDKPSIGFWLGARRISETGDVIWISKSLPVLDMEYTNFESGEPASERTGADCLKWFRGRWSMTSCSEVKAFVCEY